MSKSHMVFGVSDINFKSSNVNGHPFSSLFFMIFYSLWSLIPVNTFNSSKDALLILIGVVILNYIEFLWKKISLSVNNQQLQNKQNMQSQRLYSCHSKRKGMWEKTYQLVYPIQNLFSIITHNQEKLLTIIILNTACDIRRSVAHIYEQKYIWEKKKKKKLYLEL